MNHPMRRSRQQLSQEEAARILQDGTEGVLSLASVDGTPYGVPLNYVFDDSVIYFHMAGAGRKLDYLQENPRASFCVIEQATVVPTEFTTYFRSVIAEGSIAVIEDAQQRKEALIKLAVKYSQGVSGLEAEVERGLAHVTMAALTVQQLRGKEAIELVRARTSGE